VRRAVGVERAVGGAEGAFVVHLSYLIRAKLLRLGGSAASRAVRST
jgi:hypothetical protein